MGWQDISVPIRSGMATFEGDPPVHLERVMAMADGAVCNVSRLDFGVHSGTHVDAAIEGLPIPSGTERLLFFGDPTPTHVALLAAGVVIVEGLDLGEVEPGWYDLICVPLRIPGSDGGPARAIVRRRPD